MKLNLSFAGGLCALALSLSSLALSSYGMTLERVGSDLFATGPVVDTDVRAFTVELDKGGVQQIVLVNSPGGDLRAGMRVARMIQAAGLKTLVSGYCNSACSLMFMGGQERGFASGNKPRATSVGIHGAHDRSTRQMDPRLMPQMFALYKTQMGDKFDPDVINQALYKLETPGGMLRFRELQRNQSADQVPWFCPTETTPYLLCAKFPGKDAFSLGVVTRQDTVDITLPASMRIGLAYLGQVLPPAQPGMGERLTAALDAQCLDSLCKALAKERVDRWQQADIHKAYAVGFRKLGYGESLGLDEPAGAMLRALFACNHARNNKKLCKLVAVNDQEMGGAYDLVDQQSRAALAALPRPRDEAVQAERTEVGAGTASAFKTSALDQMTPRELQGVRRVDTAQLAAMLTSAKPPVLVDVLAAPPLAMLPTATLLLHAGMAFTDDKQDAALDQRFRDMLTLAAPDLNAPLVFYCAGSQSWHSANAALRAFKAGYTQVLWYRGGLEAWLAAGMPTTAKVALAVIQ